MRYSFFMKTVDKEARIDQPGRTREVSPKPLTDDLEYKGAGKLKGKVAIITGGDSGIGQATAIAFAKEGARAIAVIYLEEREDANKTKELVEKYGARCLTFMGDIGDSQFCTDVVRQVGEEYKEIHILVNNAAEQHMQKSVEDITDLQLESTFRTNIFSMFYLTRAALPYMKEGDTIINTTSVTAYRGMAVLLDYSSTKGAIVSFTRSLSEQLKEKGIRVNAVAPGPVWTPLIPASFPEKKVKNFGKDTMMGRAAHPYEIAPSFVFLASKDSNVMSGQVLHPNGGEMVES
jgi:NAD(P)-dependent dehydrogenase (short-subunit alcohol dehydrogenase family)